MLFKNVPTTGFLMSSRHFLIRRQENPLHFTKAATWFIYKCGKIYFAKAATWFIYKCGKIYFATPLLMGINNVSSHLYNCLYAISLGWQWTCVTNGMYSLTFGQMPQNHLLFRSFQPLTAPPTVCLTMKLTMVV